jgi:lysophospholipase L1-like esterase
MKRAASWLASLIVTLFSIVLSVVIVNYGAKLIYNSEDFQQTHRNGVRVVDYVLKLRPDIYGDDSQIIPHPYLLYANRPGFVGKGFVQNDEGGYRIVPQPTRPAGVVPRTILILGGSTTYSYPYVADPANSWPGVLQKLLGPGYRVINAGLSSATSAELLAGYMFRHRYLKPDIVIFHEGGNDVLSMMFENYSPEYTHLRAHGTRPVAGTIDRRILSRGGWPAKLLYAQNWNELSSVFLSLPYDLSGVSAADAEARAASAPTTGFERNLELLVRTIREDGATPVLFGFVQAREQFLSRNRPDLVGREHAWTIGVGRNLAIMEQIAREQQLIYLDPKDFAANDDWFLDNCHLNEAGEAAKAQFVANGIKSLLNRSAL